jgi:two-component system response regulator FlrC
MKSLQFVDPAMINLLKIAENIAASRATILLSGESGTGKEVLARWIHAKSQRSSKPFVAVNCAAIPSELLESELFGYEKGAFTGASQTKPGKFELANEGTFLLDEVSEMPLHLQAKLLRVLQEGEVERLGARQPRKVNVRIIATTNRQLTDLVTRGAFREDLFYRLNVIPIVIPPLRQRPRDIEHLAAYFANESAKANGRSMVRVSSDAAMKLKQWKWPGNVRELENVMERSILMQKDDELSADDILISGFQSIPSVSEIGPGMTISEVEKRLILQTLEHTSQNRSQAARLLGISIRTLRNKLQQFGVKHLLPNQENSHE